MPWCEACSRFWNPNSLPADGSCPSCARDMTPAAGEEAEAPHTRVDLKELAGEEGRAPWHFKLLVAAVVLYLGWRLF